MQPHHTPRQLESPRQRSRAYRYDWQVQSRVIAQRHFDRVLRHGWVGRLIDSLRGRSSALLCLADIQSPPPPSAEEILGLQTVPISQICGSEGRVHDFDRRFAPLHEHIRDRWVTLAAMRSEGHPLTPVELVQIGESYYILDGHHRISVACAFNDDTIEAHVTRWPAVVQIADCRLQVAELV
ncbi:hypothetical protein K2Z83_24155 [Oscillochloris sp. ZM17-4]|uniref:hypothetical protein n=1 Tax=Oscillochloris sp. ZM17-4 TaxID=2866714 RepID=UPI001C73BCD6|nr:hypothetical protein [Oscillochloris sp. ZM17-4]MBX0330754.1 hypothetical protein [Oscillochloris sp. ZM17-4]